MCKTLTSTAAATAPPLHFRRTQLSPEKDEHQTPPTHTQSHHRPPQNPILPILRRIHHPRQHPLSLSPDDPRESSGDGKSTGSVVNHKRNFSVDADLFEGLGIDSDGGEFCHRRSNSMDGDWDLVMVDEGKRVIEPDKLDELALIDPKRAKRILANRQSAARSKERKTRYTSELERKLQTLQNEATTLSTQVTMLQRDTSGLTSENKELRMRLEAIEQQAKLRDDLSETLKGEVQRLKIEAGHVQPLNGTSYNRSPPPQLSSHPQMFHHFANQHTQPPLQQQQSYRMPDSTTTNRSARPTFMDFYY